MNTIHTEQLNIQIGNHNSQSHLAYPKGQSKALPGVLVLPEFWGLTQHTKNQANKLANQGYCALAVDVYGDGHIGQTANEAANKMNQLYADMNTTSKKMQGWWQTLKNLKQTDETKTASIGYCLGGALSLHLARMGADITGVVSFHGKLAPLNKERDPCPIKAKILVCHGADDTMIPDTDVANFKKEMDGLNADYQFIAYPNAKHGFTNPKATENGQKFNIPTAYDESADRASYNEMLRFFKQIFA